MTNLRPKPNYSKAFMEKLPHEMLFPKESGSYMDEGYFKGSKSWFEFLQHKDQYLRGNVLDPDEHLEFHYIRLPIGSFIDEVMPLLKNRKVKSFLDVGCGGGDKLDVVKKAFPRLHVGGIEHDPAMAIWASTVADEIICADALSQTYERWDFIYAYWPISEPAKMSQLIDLIMDTKKKSARFMLFGFSHHHYSHRGTGKPHKMKHKPESFMASYYP